MARMSKKRISSSPYQKRTTIFDRFLTHMKKPMKLATALITASALLALNSVGAADDDHKGHVHEGKKGHVHTHAAQPQYGGIVSVVNDINYELVIKADTLTLYITDHDQPIDTKHGSATMRLVSASDKIVEAKLIPAGGNKLQAKGAFKIQPGTNAAALVQFGQQSSQVVRFVLK